MTTSEAASRLGLTARSVARLINTGKIAAIKHGRDYWIDEAEIDRYQSTRRKAGRPKGNEKD